MDGAGVVGNVTYIMGNSPYMFLLSYSNHQRLSVILVQPLAYYLFDMDGAVVMEVMKSVLYYP